MNFERTIKKYRKAHGYTQQELAAEADVSLATVQSIEAGEANPSLAIVESLLAVFDLSWQVRPLPIAWDNLALLGLPLQAEGSENTIVRTPKKLVRALKTCCNQIVASEEGSHSERHIEALQAMLLALKTHYPKFYCKHLNSQKSIIKLTPKETSGRLVKLRRLSLATLGEYL